MPNQNNYSNYFSLSFYLLGNLKCESNVYFSLIKWKGMDHKMHLLFLNTKNMEIKIKSRGSVTPELFKLKTYGEEITIDRDLQPPPPLAPWTKARQNADRVLADRFDAWNIQLDGCALITSPIASARPKSMLI